ncbi:hypothetical protein COCON_G00233720 [Conger conger]|uniref:Immunoglobulin V-set domain-containing protein n=1 Tax=Conger conger TaxID=82655 RepID=A0A9Q1CUD7_CONCO|nr:hypothetical protein COCON_G00233720 [Conger conger]
MKADWSMCLYLILLILHQTSRSEMFQLLGPAGPVIAVVGEDVVLPTHLKPNISAEDMRIEWFRPQHRDPLVHLYLLGESRNEPQNPSYSGRTALFPEELREGNTSLRLSRVQPDLIWQDSGGHNLPAEKPEILRDSLGLITIRSQIIIRKRKGISKFSCRVLQQKLHEEKVTVFYLHGE